MIINAVDMRKSQRGVVLVVSLMLLLVMTIIGLASMATSTLEEKMTGNLRDQSLAFEAAESALRDAEAWLDTISGISEFNGSKGLYQMDGNTGFTKWNSANSVEYSKKNKLSGVSENPRYIIRPMDEIPGWGGDKSMGGYGESKTVPDITVFEVTARGSGSSSNSAVRLRSLYGRAL